MAKYEVLSYGSGPRSKGAVIQVNGFLFKTRWVKVLDTCADFDKWVNLRTGSYKYVDCWDGDLWFEAQKEINSGQS